MADKKDGEGGETAPNLARSNACSWSGSQQFTSYHGSTTTVYPKRQSKRLRSVVGGNRCAQLESMSRRKSPGWSTCIVTLDCLEFGEETEMPSGIPSGELCPTDATKSIRLSACAMASASPKTSFFTRCMSVAASKTCCLCCGERPFRFRPPSSWRARSAR